MRLLSLLALSSLFLFNPIYTDEAMSSGNATMTPMEKVVVEANKRLTLSRWAPQSITSLNAADLESGGIKEVRDASLYVPNLYMNQFSARRTSFPYIRGIGSGQGNPSVVTYIDGIPQLNNDTSNIRLIGIDRLEFHRGPQAALYGRGSLGGLIHYHTREPAQYREASARLTGGTDGLGEAEILAGLPIPKGAANLALAFSDRDGYTTNNTTGQDLDDSQIFHARLKSHWSLGKWKLGLSGHHETSEQGGFPLGQVSSLRTSPWEVQHDYEGRSDRDISQIAFKASTEIDDIQIDSVLAWQSFDSEELSDFDFSALDLLRRTNENDSDAFIHELRVSAKDWKSLSSIVRWRWMAGWLAYQNEQSQHVANEFRPAFVAISPFFVGTSGDRSEFDDQGFALFTQTELSLNERIDLAFGLRFDHEKKEAALRPYTDIGGTIIPGTAVDAEDSFSQWVPKFTMAMHWCEHFSTFITAARGFKSGGFNGRAPTGSENYDQEASTSFELGFKGEGLKGRLQYQTTWFNIQWEDMQLSVVDPLTGSFYLDNAGESSSRGIEIETSYRIAAGSKLFAGISTTDARFDSYSDPFAGNVAGKKLSAVPVSTWHIGYRHRENLKRGYYVAGQVSYNGVGAFYLDAGNTASQESYQIARIRIEGGREDWSAALWADNLFEEDYLAVAFQQTPGVFIGENGAPRTVGLTLTYRH